MGSKTNRKIDQKDYDEIYAYSDGPAMIKKRAFRIKISEDYRYEHKYVSSCLIFDEIFSRSKDTETAVYHYVSANGSIVLNSAWKFLYKYGIHKPET